MKFKKDGLVYESTEAMLKANCDSIATCMTECEIRKRCRKGQSCEDYAYVNPEEVAQYLGFEVLEDDDPTIAEIIAKHSEDDTPTIAEAVKENSEAVKPDPVNHPAHYTSGGIECIDAMQAAFGAEAVKDFCLCNAFKYIYRSQRKNGREDIEKAQWYLDKYIELDDDNEN